MGEEGKAIGESRSEQEKDGEQENDPTESQFHPAYPIQAKFQLGEYIRNHPSPASEPHSRHQITPGIETGESLRHKIETQTKAGKVWHGLMDWGLRD